MSYTNAMPIWEYRDTIIEAYLDRGYRLPHEQDFVDFLGSIAEQIEDFGIIMSDTQPVDESEFADWIEMNEDSPECLRMNGVYAV